MISYEFVTKVPAIFVVGTTMTTLDYVIAPLEIRVPHRTLNAVGSTKMEDRIKELLEAMMGTLNEEFGGEEK